MVTKKDLLSMCNVLGITSVSAKSKQQLRDLIKEYQDSRNVKIIKNGNKVKIIYHTADIHIRILERHQEYRQVFKNLYEYISTQEDLENSVLVICGDIFHNRDHLVSETILLFNNFIERLTSVIDVVMIVGNHDVFTHGDRLDTITGIVDIKMFPNLFFLKNSGIYKYNNIDFVVSSLVDNRFIRANETESSDTKDSVKVALYHGPISGSKLDNSYSLPNSEGLLKVGDFKGYDYVLLGDIHKRQFLTETVAYPGSLIQQNHKEEPVHGILRWNLEEKTSDFVPIHNDYGYITVIVKNKLITGLTETLPKKSRIKILHDYSEDLDLDDIKKQLAAKSEILCITKEFLSTDNNSTSMTDSSLEPKDPVSREDLDKEIFLKLIEKYSENVKEKLLNLHSTYVLAEGMTDPLVRNSGSWEIESIKFKNVFIYGGDHTNVIDFDSNKGITGILGNNAIGKSCILNVMLYCLFGNICKSKNYSNRNIINKNSKDFYICMTIKKNNCRYTIERRGHHKARKNGIKGMEESITFRELNLETEKEVNLTDSTKADTTEKIQEILGLTNKDNFIMTNVISYTNYVSLLNMTNSDIAQTFNDLFNLQKYKEIYTQVLKKHKSISDSLRSLEGECKGLEETYKRSTVSDCVVNETEKRISQVLLELKEVEDLIMSILQDELSVQLADNCITKPTCVADRKAIEDKLTLLNLTMGIVPEGDKKMSDDMLGHLIKVTECSIDKKCARKDVNYGSASELDNAVVSLEKDIKVLRNKLKPIFPHCSEKEYKKVLENEVFSVDSFIDDLKVCKKTSDGTDYVIDKELYIDLLDFMHYMKNSTEMFDSKIKIINYERYINDFSTNKKIEDEIVYLQSQLNFLLQEKVRYLSDIREYKKLTEKMESILDYQQNEEKINSRGDILKKKKELLYEKSALQKQLAELNADLGKLKYKIQQSKSLEERLSKIKVDVSNLSETENIYKIYKGLMSDKNLPKMILYDTIKKVEMDANKLIYKLAGLYVILASGDTVGEGDGEGGKWEIIIKKSDIILGIEQISGYERFIVNIGLKIALDKHKFYSGSKIFFIDEMFDCISEENFDKVDDLFLFLRNYYKNIVVISHNEKLKGKLNNRINIQTDGVCSKII
jgi:DNA repair exonuclease SbcCD ATPase subunit